VVKCCSTKGSWRRFEAATSTTTAVDSGAVMTALRQHRLQLFVHALPVQSLYQLGHRSCEDFADAKEGGDGDGASGLHLLPVAGGERKNCS
jgi:hypothetical protein